MRPLEDLIEITTDGFISGISQHQPLRVEELFPKIDQKPIPRALWGTGVLDTSFPWCPVPQTSAQDLRMASQPDQRRAVECSRWMWNPGSAGNLYGGQRWVPPRVTSKIKQSRTQDWSKVPWKTP